MPAVKYPRDGRAGRGRGFQYRALPPWLQWALPFGVAGALVLALVLFVQHQTSDVSQVAGYNSAAAVREQFREDTILVRQQQAPHRGRLEHGEGAAAGLRASIVAWMNHQINVGAINGPIKHAACRSAGGAGGRLVFHCTLTVSTQDVTYPFDGVVAPSASAITWCQRVAPPVPSMNVPVSKRCT